MDNSLDPHLEDLARVQGAVHTLIEYYDSVQIFATRHEPGDGGTRNYNAGGGNWYARVGHVRDWLIRIDERSRHETRNLPPQVS